MEIFPAIDLKEKKAVRLTKGLMESAKIYSDSPWELAKKFEDYGARWLHIVDLDGAFAGEPKNYDVIEKIKNSSNLKVQIGGGIRDESILKRYTNLGVDRLILGSIAAKNPNFVIDMSQKYRVAVGIDAKNGFVATEGWAEESNISATNFAKKFQDIDIDAIICTDISKDGTLSGVNEDFTQDIALASKKFTIASGGVKDIEDIRKIKDNQNIGGVIVGKAYYEKKLDLQEAFRLLN